MAKVDPTQPYLAGDAKAEDYPNPDTEPHRTPAVFPGDSPVEGAQRATTGYSDATNFGGTSDYAAVPKKGHKDTSAMSAGPTAPTVDDSVAVEYNSGEPTGLVQTRESGARDYNAFSTTVLAGTPGVYPGAPVMLLGDDSNRARIHISNAHATDPVLIGPLDQVNSGGGFLLPATRILELQVQGAIYACVPLAGTNAIPVGVWVEIN